MQRRAPPSAAKLSVAATPVARLLLVFALGLLLLACGEKGAKLPKGPIPATPTPGPDVFRKAAEAQVLPGLTPVLASLVKEQRWFGEMSPAQLEMLRAMQACEKAAIRRGEGASVPEILRYASEQGWYADGLSDREAKGLGGVFAAYSESLTDDNAFVIGGVLSATIRDASFEVLNLPETGELVIIVSSGDAALGAKALGLAVDAFPKIEALTGKYPFKFLHVTVTTELPVILAGVSYDEFIALDTKAVDASTMIHEMAHSILFGQFPLWFEEGFAHFTEFLLTDALEKGARQYTLDLSRLRRTKQLDIRSRTSLATLHGQLAERAQGFLFIKGVHDIMGAETFSRVIRTLRTRTYNDQDIIRALLENTPPELEARMRQHVCESIVGTARSYCVPS